MKYRVLWGFGPAPGRVSDRKGLSRAGGLSGRTMRRQSTGNRGCVPNVPQTCGNVSQTCRVRSVHYTTARAFPRLCRLARRRAYAESRRAGPGRFCCLGGRRLPASWATGPTWRPCWPCSPGWPCLPDLAWDGATWCLCAATCGFRAGVGASAWRTGPAFAVSSGMPFRKKSKLAKGRRWERMRPPDRGR
jgi:hypothetical protein